MSRIIKPQAGPQEKFLATSADIAIYGGAAGGGKTYALLIEPLRYMNVDKFRAVIFRNSYTQISAAGGLWDESMSIYTGIDGAVPTKSPRYMWSFNGKAKIGFDYIARDADVYRWQGSQIAMIGFDELTHFSERQFSYMMSRNRSTCGVKPYIRATCNPDAESWVAEFIAWWIDQDTGYPIKERSGKVRYMCRGENGYDWGSSKQELVDMGYEVERIKSVTFIASTLDDNKILLEKDPTYKANLQALSFIESERLLKGNWKVKSAAGLYFKRSQLGNVLEVVPADVTEWVRCWDLAATAKDENGNAAYTAGVLIGKRRDGRYIVADVINEQLSAGDVRSMIKLTAQRDKAKFGRVKVRLPKDPGQAGKEQAESYIKHLAGFNVVTVSESGSKEARAEPVAAQWQAGNFDILHAAWNEPFLNQLEGFPEARFKDMVDALANGFAEIETKNTFSLRNML